MAPKGVRVGGDLEVTGTVYAYGPVFVEGINVKEKFEELEERLNKITSEDLPLLESNIEKILSDFPVIGETKSSLEKLLEYIKAGKDLVEIIRFIKVVWIQIGPIITDILLSK